MIQNGSGGVLGTLHSWILVPTWESRLALLAGGLQGQILGSLRCGSLLGNYGIPNWQISFQKSSLLHKFQDCYVSDNLP